MRKKKNRYSHPYLWASCFYGLLAFFSISSIALQDEEFSTGERRRLTQMPALSLSSILDGRFADQFESYAQDSIAGRNSLLYLKSWSSLHLFGALDDNGLIQKDGSIIKIEKQINEDSLSHAAEIFDRIEERYLKNTSCKVYVSIIPDKGYFVQGENALIMDYDKFFVSALDSLPDGEQIDLTDVLSLSDYYNSDPHWKQEQLLDTAKKLAQSMGVEIASDWQMYQALDSFQGAYSGQTSLPHEKDSLNVLWNPSMENWTVTSGSDGRLNSSSIYQKDKLTGLDPYEFFLGGNPGLAVIENPDVTSGRELILFKDSFGSSIAPILASGYSKVTIVDLRNLPSWNLGRFIEFDDQDVLFLFSTTVLNDSQTLK